MILIITNHEDYYTVDLVQQALEAAGKTVVRLNMDLFTQGITITETISNRGKEIVVKTPTHPFKVADVEAVWLRKYWLPAHQEDIPAKFHEGIRRECKEVLDILINAFDPSIIIDPWIAVQQASNKYLQAELAVACGLSFPNTLITNDPQALKDFYAQENGKIVAKMLSPLSASMNATGYFMYTNLVTQEYLDDAEMLEVCPMCFQALVNKAYELRIAYVDGDCFTGKIQVQEGDDIDIRISGTKYQWEAYDLPEELQHQLQSLMQQLDLRFGAIDMLKSKQGEYLFLEVNPIGEWGMLQRDLNLPIAEAIAKALLKRLK